MFGFYILRVLWVSFSVCIKIEFNKLVLLLFVCLGFGGGRGGVFCNLVLYYSIVLMFVVFGILAISNFIYIIN